MLKLPKPGEAKGSGNGPFVFMVLLKTLPEAIK